MAYDLAKVTANGNNLIAQILANKSSLSIDKIEISDTQLSSTTDISTMTSVPKVVQTVSANGFSKNSNTLIISTVVDNSSISADYKAWVFGIWGSDSQNGQSQLIAVITSTNSPDTIPAFSGSTPVSYTYKFNIGFSNASQIQFNMIDDAFATNDTVVHTTGDETIDGQKKFDTDPTDSAGNAYAKTVDVNQQLDKKVTDNGDGTIKVNGNIILPSNDSVLARIDGTYTDMNNIPIGWWYLNGWSATSVSNWGLPQSFYYVHCFTTSLSWDVPGVIQVAYDVTSNNVYVRTRCYTNWTSWKLTADDSKVLHTADMRKPASDVAGIEEVNTKQDKLTITPADDSKVAHLSGANNFDTVPTVNNNPLLLASSLPSDLARLSQDANFTAKLQQNGQDVALANHTLARNPNTGSVSETNTFTAAQTFSIAPTITDASKDKGDNQAATMADLKSLENSAWHQLDLASASPIWSVDSSGLYKIDSSKNMINLVISGSFTNVYSNVVADFSGVITSITSISGYLKYIYNSNIDDMNPLYPDNNKILTGGSSAESKYVFGNIIIHYDKLV
uniref:hypothetical protein n=1 Tax=Lentilactobacillus hilgardii TaxID=1588 RepID=UPI00403F3DF3